MIEDTKVTASESKTEATTTDVKSTSVVTPVVVVESKEPEKTEAKNAVTPEKAKEMVEIAKQNTVESSKGLSDEAKAIIEGMKKSHADVLAAKDAESKTAKSTYEAALDIQSSAIKKVNEDLQSKLDTANKEIETLKAEIVKLSASLKDINDKADAEKLSLALNARKSVLETELGLKGDMLQKYWVESSSKTEEEFSKYVKDLKALMSYSKVGTEKVSASIEVPSVDTMKKIDAPIPIVTEVAKAKNGQEIGQEILSKFFKNKPGFKKSK